MEYCLVLRETVAKYVAHVGTFQPLQRDLRVEWGTNVHWFELGDESSASCSSRWWCSLCMNEGQKNLCKNTTDELHTVPRPYDAIFDVIFIMVG